MKTIQTTTAEMDKVFRMDTDKRFVRITGIRNNQFIEFDFSIGEPGIYVELILPFDDFQKFCSKNKIVHLTTDQAAEVDYDRLKWRFGQPGITE